MKNISTVKPRFTWSRIQGLSASRLVLALLVLLPACSALAFPPAPYNLIYGNVRDQYGTPLLTSEAKIVLRTANGVTINGKIIPGLAIGINYELQVPMDAGLTLDSYKASALTPSTPFKMYVVIGTTTNIPIEMTGSYVQLGQSAKSSRIDLTLGVDANGNGIPDAWENAFLASLRTNIDLSTLKSNMDLTGSGRTLRQEFLLGTYPFDPDHPFKVRLISLTDGVPVVEFSTMTARYYILQGSADLQQWTNLSFTVPSENNQPRTSYYAPDIRTVQVQGIPPATGPALQFFRLLLQ